MLLAQAAADASEQTSTELVEIVTEWLGVLLLLVSLVLGASKLASMIITKHRKDQAEAEAAQEVVVRFARFFPPEGDEHPMSVPSRLDRGEVRFDEIDEELGELGEKVDGLATTVTGLCDTVNGHTAREEDLGSRLEGLVGRVESALSDLKGSGP